MLSHPRFGVSPPKWGRFMDGDPGHQLKRRVPIGSIEARLIHFGGDAPKNEER